MKNSPNKILNKILHKQLILTTHIRTYVVQPRLESFPINYPKQNSIHIPLSGTISLYYIHAIHGVSLNNSYRFNIKRKKLTRVLKPFKNSSYKIPFGSELLSEAFPLSKI